MFCEKLGKTVVAGRQKPPKAAFFENFSEKLLSK
jgi:hypothetical protein